MKVLSHELLKDCRITLLQCDEFESYRRLKTAFASVDLFPFRIGLPSANNPKELLDLFLDFIVDKKLSDGRFVFPLFLAELLGRYYPPDSRHQDLANLHGRVETYMTSQTAESQKTPRRSIELFRQILQLNYRSQVRFFKSIVDSHRLGAFLIHGEPGHGQQLLTHRLSRLKPEWETSKKIILDVSSNGIGKSNRIPWRQIACNLGVPSTTSQDKLTEMVFQWWLTQDIIFIIYPVDYMPSPILASWINELWHPLVEKAEQHIHFTQRLTHLILFLVDYSGTVSGSKLNLIQSVNDPNFPKSPLQLPINEKIPHIDLDYWIDAAAEVLPNGLTAANILEKSDNGVPQYVYEIICDHCGISWQGELARWLT